MNVYEEVEAFYEGYRGEKRVYGYSEQRRPLFAMFVGRHVPPVGISQYAIHGREYLTALLALEHLRRGVRRGGVWILPMTNPDGALLSEIGISAADPRRRPFLLRCNGGFDFSLWKANVEGVDLNVNFNARFGTGRRNVFSPAPENYVGESPLCAAESAALAAFTRETNPDFTVSWHTKGEEIYWRFHQSLFRALRDKKLANCLRRATGYPLKSAKGSAGGYKDWCIEALRIPAFTVECGSDALSHPLGRERLFDVAGKCGNALRALTEGF